MPQVTVLIKSHEYEVACGEGQEKRTAELAAYVDSKVKSLVAAVGNVGDQRLLLLASLLLVDELWDQQDANSKGAIRADDSQRSTMLEKLADRIDQMAALLPSEKSKA